MAGDPFTLLHIGYQKTGSSWLQEHYFRSGGLPFRRADRRLVNEVFTQPNPLEFDADRAREALAPFLREASAAGAVPVLSQERLAGAVALGGYDSKEIARRLADVFPGARALIVIREQASMILSSYKQYARTGGVMSLRRFLSPTRRVRSMPQFDLAFFEYDRLIRLYRELFGADRVLVLAYEQLRVDPAGFVAAIARFCGVETPPVKGEDSRANVSWSGPVLAAKLWFNLFFVHGPQNPGCILPIGENRLAVGAFALADRLVPRFVRRWSDRRMSARIRAAAGDRYRESNARTAAMTGLDLASLSYDMPPGSGAAGPAQAVPGGA